MVWVSVTGELGADFSSIVLPQITRIVWEGREAERHSPSTHRENNSPLSLCHVIPGSFLLPSPHSVFALQMLLAKIYKHDCAESMKPIMNKQCLPGLLAIFY